MANLLPPGVFPIVARANACEYRLMMVDRQLCHLYIKNKSVLFTIANPNHYLHVAHTQTTICRKRAITKYKYTEE